MVEPHIGPVALLGSGETSAVGGRIFEALAAPLPWPPRVAVLETPAGFELNSAQVAGRVAGFIETRLQNYSPQVELIAARRRGTADSPDNPELTRPLLYADLIFAGPGSPTYTVRQLRGSLAWQRLQARHRLGGALILASAAVMAAGSFTLPVYEIYKAGEDPHWRHGLDLWGAFGLQLVTVPHWNNSDGGSDVDTSRCFVGRSRFESLLALLPAGCTVLGIDEQTAVLIDLAAQTFSVTGSGVATIWCDGRRQEVASGASSALSALGEPRCPALGQGLPRAVCQEAMAALQERQAGADGSGQEAEPPPEVLALAEQREEARSRQDWETSDALRRALVMLDWKVSDTPDGQKLEPAEPE